MDSGNMSEVEIEGVQPDEVVVTESEELEATEATPQAEEAESTEQPAVYIEDEGDQQEEPKSGEMTRNQARAALREEREKRKRKNAELDEAKRKQAELEERLERAERLAFEAKVGSEPKLEDYDYMADYLEARKDYDQKREGLTPPKPEEPKAKVIELSVDQEDHADFSRLEMRKHLPDYDEAEKAVDDWIATTYPNMSGIKEGIIALLHAHDIDYAKAIYAINKIPSLKEELAKAPNQMAIVAGLKKAASKVKVRQPAKIDSKPEPSLSSTGSINAASKALEKAREAYAKDPSVANFKKVGEAKKKVAQS